MKHNKKIIIIVIALILLIVISIVTFLGYRKYLKDEQVKEFSSYIQDYKIRCEQYNLDNDEKDKYKEFMTKADIAINMKSSEYIDNLETELKNFEKNILNDNIKNINGEFNKIKEFDINKLSKDSQTKLNNIEKDIYQYIKDTKFVDAKKKIDEANNIINEYKNDLNKKNKEKQIEEEQKKRKNKEKNEEKKKESIQTDISGNYSYEKTNKYGVNVEYEDINIQKINNERIEFSGSANYLLHGYESDGSTIKAEDVTKEMWDNGNCISRSGMKSGFLEYKGNGIWEGLIYSELSSSDGGTPDDPKTKCSLVVINNNEIKLIFGDNTIKFVRQ